MSDAGIRILHDRVDAFFRKAVEDLPGAFACGPGCTGCCRVDLTVFPVEAAPIRQALALLAPGVVRDAADRGRRGRHCAMLGDDGLCIVYDARPAICRSHGLPVLHDGRVDACPRNFRGIRPARTNVMDVETLNEALVRLDVAAGGRGERVRLAELALEAAVAMGPGSRG